MIEIVGWLAMMWSWSTLFVAGKYRWGWLANAGVAVPWVIYGLHYGALPVIVNTLVFSAIAIRNWYVWNDREDDERIQYNCPKTIGEDDVCCQSAD